MDVEDTGGEKKRWPESRYGQWDMLITGEISVTVGKLLNFYGS